MTGITIGILGVLAFLVMIFIGLPISVAMFASGVGGCMFLLRTATSAFDMVGASVFGTFSSYTITVVPMFLLMGELASETGIGRDLFDCFQTLSGHKKAGLAKASSIVCTIFGAICGSTAATAGMMSRVAYPQMKRYKYDEGLAIGIIASSACLANLIPPSLQLITYGIISETSIGSLFIAGISVGIMLMLMLILAITIWAKINPKIAPDALEKATISQMWKAIRHGGFIEIILVFALSMGGMFVGWFTPTEAGAVGVAGMLIVALLFKRFSMQALFRALKNTLTMSGMIYCMIAGAKALGSMITYSRIPQALANWVSGLAIPSFLIILMFTLIYFVLGCILDGTSVILLTTPVFLPIIITLGYSPIWFGCYLVVVMGLGSVTPPVGSACFIASGASGVSLEKTFRGTMPFWGAYIVCAIVLTIFPVIATWLPSLMA